jgi:hypothetical protein
VPEPVAGIEEGTETAVAAGGSNKERVEGSALFNNIAARVRQCFVVLLVK